MADPSPDAPFYFPELDGLRFFAFLLVFIHHAPVLGLPMAGFLHAHGWIGVDLFFALSAFLFVKILAKEFNRTGTIGIGHFYLRRGLRIWPLYFLFCFLKIVLHPGFGREYLFSWRAFGLFTFTDNLFSAFRGYNPIPDTAHLWTISYEEQFYLVIPLALLFLFRGRRARAAGFLAGGALLSTLLRAVLIQARLAHPAIWVLPVTHFESILLGIVVGLGGYDVLLKRVPAGAVLAAGLGFGWLMTRLPSIETVGWSLMPSYLLIGLCTSLLVQVVFRAGKAPWMRWISARPLVYLGKISYGLYVYHVFALALGRKLLRSCPPPLQDPATALVSLGLTVALAALSYRYLEKPFLVLKKRFEVIHSRPA